MRIFFILLLVGMAGAVVFDAVVRGPDGGRIAIGVIVVVVYAGLLAALGCFGGDPSAGANQEWRRKQRIRRLTRRGNVRKLTALADRRERGANQALAELLAARGDLGALTARADRHVEARGPLARLLADRGDLATLTARADSGDGWAASALADELVRRGDLETLTARAGRGDRAAAQRLAQLPPDRGAVTAIDTRPEAGTSGPS